MSGSSISRYSCSAPRSRTRSSIDRRQPARNLGVPDERRRLVVGRRRRDRLDAVLRRQVVELVRRPARLDQVGEQHRVLDRLHRQPRQRLEVVRDQLRLLETALERGLPGADDDAVVLAPARSARRESRAPRVPALRGTRPRATRPPCPARASAARGPPRRGCRRGRAGCGTRSAGTSRAAASGPAGAARAPRGRSRARGRGASSRAASTGRACSAYSVTFFSPRGRQLVGVLDHFLERAVLRDQLTCGLVADARDAGDVVRRVALEADEVGDLVGTDAVTRLDAVRRVHIHVRDAARRHHQARRCRRRAGTRRGRSKRRRS